MTGIRKTIMGEPEKASKTLGNRPCHNKSWLGIYCHSKSWFGLTTVVWFTYNIKQGV